MNMAGYVGHNLATARLLQRRVMICLGTTMSKGVVTTDP